MYPDYLEGLLLVDKPSGPTSHDVVQKVKRALEAEKAGHLGTLDPAATGLMVVCINGATKIAPFLMAHDKVYRGTMVLGVETDTQDGQGEVVATADPGGLTKEDIQRAFAGFSGSMLQRPPAYSAVKQGGVPLYKLARAGKKAVAAIRQVLIKELEIEAIEMPRVTFRAAVSSGTYIRTLAHDIGQKLGVGAHLGALRRLKSGPFEIENAIALDELETGPGKRRVIGALIPLSKALEGHPEILLKGDAAYRVQHGTALTGADFKSGEARLVGTIGEVAKAIDPEGNLIAVMASTGELTDEAVLWKPLRVWDRTQTAPER